MQKSPLAGIDANLLVALEALLRDEQVGAAAQRVGLSESAMSHALSRARELLGDPLLVRVGRRMTMTERARAIAPALREGVRLLASATATTSALDPSSVRRAVRIAATDFGHSVVGPALYQLLAREAPLVDLVFLPFAPTSLSLLASGEIDLAISKMVKLRSLHAQLLIEEPFLCVARKGHPILRSRITPKQFAAYGHVLISPGGRVSGAVDKALLRRGLKRRVAYVSPTFLIAAQVVEKTDLLLTASKRNATTVASLLELATFPPPLALPPFLQGMLWHERQQHHPFLAWLRAKISELVKTA